MPSLMWPHSRVCQVVLALHWSASVPTHRVSHPLVSYTRLQSLVLSGFQMAKVEATRSYKTRLWNSHYVTFATSVCPSQSRGQVRCKGAGEIGSFSSWKLQKSMWMGRAWGLAISPALGWAREWAASKRKRRLDSLEAAQGAPRDPRRDSRGELSLGFPSRRGLTPRGSLECNPEIPAFPGEEN